MAWSQTEASGHMKGIGKVAREDSNGHWYLDFGPVRLYFGAGGTPNAVVTAAVIGSLAFRVDNAAALYVATDSAGAFTVVGSLT